MAKKSRTPPRREDSLSPERIVDASIEILDSQGERGLTFRALSEHLATGPGAIYWHVANKSDLLTAACDAIVARAMSARADGATPAATIRAIALSLFDAIDAHPWVGSALTRASGKLPTIRMVERIGQQVRALGVPRDSEWTVASALLSYIVGVSAQNAANTHLAREQSLGRDDFLGDLANAWSQLDPDAYPFTRSIAGQMRDHDDRADFLAGIDLFLRGIGAGRRR